MKKLGFVLLFGGFLAGAFFTVSEVETISKPAYAPCLLAMFVGTVLLRRVRSTEAADISGTQASIATLNDSVGRLVKALRDYNGSRQEAQIYALPAFIDAELLPDLDRFAEARESMINVFGLQTYANVMSAFATGERLLNRCWSASADGYVDEAFTNLDAALQELEKTQSLLTEA